MGFVVCSWSSSLGRSLALGVQGVESLIILWKGCNYRVAQAKDTMLAYYITPS